MKIDKNESSIVISGVPEETSPTTKKSVGENEAYRKLKALLTNIESGAEPQTRKIKKLRKPKIKKKKDKEGLVFGTYTGHLQAKGPILVAQADIAGTVARPYPGPNSFLGLRALAWSSTVVMAIVNYRRNQLVKKDIAIVPKNSKEPPFRMSILDYPTNEIMYLPYLTDEEKRGLVNIFRKLDPLGVHPQKGLLFNEAKEDETLSKYEIELVEYFDKKHWEFHMKRSKDIRGLLKFLNDPDPFYSEKSSWKYLLSIVLEDLLLLDRGAVIKTRDEDGRIVALTPIDGATIRPVISEDGYVEKYAQVVDGHEFVAVYDKEDVIIFSMNNTSDVYRYGYGWPNMEILYRTVAADIFIDKGNLDYYRKGGSVPEGIIIAEPPGNADDNYVALSKEQVDAIQRQIQSIMMSDYTQVPVVSGAKLTFLDFKGKRKDMQFKELAEYLTRKICAVFQVSPQDVGVLADVNRSTAEVQMSLTKSKGLETLAAAISEEFTRGFIDEFRKEKDLKLWWVEDDLKNERDAWTVINGQLTAGVVTVNEVRHRYGEPPVPWGDVPLIGGKNWRSEEEVLWEQKEQQKQMLGGGGIPGIPGAGGVPAPPPAPGMNQPGQQSVIPGPDGKLTMPNPGQIKGQSLGTPPKMKSVDAIDLEAPIIEEDPDLDVEELLTSIVFDENQLTESPSDEEPIDLLEAMDEFVRSNILDVYVSRRGEVPEVTIVVPSQNLDRTRSMQLLGQLITVREVYDRVSELTTPTGSVKAIKYRVSYSPNTLTTFKDKYLQAVSFVFWLSPVREISVVFTSEKLDKKLLEDGFLVVPDSTLKLVKEMFKKNEFKDFYFDVLYNIGNKENEFLFTSLISSDNGEAFEYFFDELIKNVKQKLDNKEEDDLYVSLISSVHKLASVLKGYAINDDSKIFKEKYVNKVVDFAKLIIQYTLQVYLGFNKRRAMKLVKLFEKLDITTEVFFDTGLFDFIILSIVKERPAIKKLLTSKDEKDRKKVLSLILAQSQITLSDRKEQAVLTVKNYLTSLKDALTVFTDLPENVVEEEINRQIRFIDDICDSLNKLLEAIEENVGEQFDLDFIDSLRNSVCLLNMDVNMVFVPFDEEDDSELLAYSKALYDELKKIKLTSSYFQTAILADEDPVRNYYNKVKTYLGVVAAYFGAVEVALDEFRSVLSAELGVDVDTIKLPKNAEPYETLTELLGQLSIGNLKITESPLQNVLVKALINPEDLTDLEKATIKSMVD